MIFLYLLTYRHNHWRQKFLQNPGKHIKFVFVQLMVLVLVIGLIMPQLQHLMMDPVQMMVIWRFGECDGLHLERI